MQVVCHFNILLTEAGMFTLSGAASTTSHLDINILSILHCLGSPLDLSLAKDVKLGKYTGNRTPGRRVAVHYATAAPRKLHYLY